MGETNETIADDVLKLNVRLTGELRAKFIEYAERNRWRKGQAARIALEDFFGLSKHPGAKSA